MHYLLIYDVGRDYLERRAEFRNEHLKLAWEAHARGELVLGGAFRACRPVRDARPRSEVAGQTLDDRRGSRPVDLSPVRLSARRVLRPGR